MIGNGVTGPGCAGSGAGVAASGEIAANAEGACISDGGAGAMDGVVRSAVRVGNGRGGCAGVSIVGVLIRLTISGAALRKAVRTGAWLNRAMNRIACRSTVAVRATPRESAL